MRRAAVVLVGLLAAGCRHPEPETMETQAAVPVELAEPRVGTITAYVRATGLVDAAPGADWTVTAPEAARVSAVRAAAGDAVKRGAVLVEFDAPGMRVELATRSGALATAEARLETARRSRERVATLFDKGIAARKDLDEAVRELAEAEAAVREATQAKGAAASLTGQARASAPFDGIVAQRWHNPGELVDAHEHVLRVVDTRRLEVAVAVAAGDAARIHAGQSARVLLPGSEEPVEGAVVGEPAVADPATGTVAVRVKLAGKAPVGTPVQVEIAADEHENAVVVPAAAVLKEDGQAAVFVVDDGGHVHKRPVTLGLASGPEVEIATGLDAKARIVTEGVGELPDGAAVTAARE
jgi:membrane fusion protein (multidrug efflux system)